MATPCSFAPISAPHIQNGRESRTACVSGACSISIHVQRTRGPAAWRRRGCHSRSCASFGSRSEFFAKSTRPGATCTSVSHTAAAGRAERRRDELEAVVPEVHVVARRTSSASRSRRARSARRCWRAASPCTRAARSSRRARPAVRPTASHDLRELGVLRDVALVAPVRSEHGARELREHAVLLGHEAAAHRLDAVHRERLRRADAHADEARPVLRGPCRSSGASAGTPPFAAAEAADLRPRTRCRSPR